jgi:molecular chaperone DnaK
MGDKEPNQSVNPDEVVAVGAAIQAGVLTGEVKGVLLLDVTPLSLGIETLGGMMTKLIERNTTIPVRRSETFSTADDNQTAVEVHVLQGEREMARDNRSLGHFRLEGIRPARRGMPQIEVTFDIDANGILTATARDKDTDKEQQITVSGSTQLSQEEVKRMVADAQSHAAEDRRRREEVEARNTADALAYQVERQLQELGSNVPLHEKARAEQLISEVRQLVQSNSTDTTRLRQLTSDLQQLTAGLAEAPSRSRPAADSERREASRSQQGGPDDVIDAEFTQR